MLSALALAAIALPFVTAEVFPNFPAGDVLRSGQNCHIAWAGDTASTTTWKDMSIQFMTGPNLNMVHITTVALHLDGTKSGSFDWTCPEVTDNSAIYFYQFTSPKSVNTQWTTRFTIASATGATNAPPHALHPDGKPPAWGSGALKNPSQATPPPVYGTPTDPGVPGPTPTNVAPGVIAGCSNWYNRNDGLLCWQIVERFGITLDQFSSWNGANVCNTLQDNKSYCVKNTGTPTNPGTPQSTPTNVAPGVGSGCTQFFTETNLLCFEIASQFGISVEQFESWNGSGVCSRLQTGLAYCVKGGTAAQPTPTNVAPGVVAGCTGFFVETNLLCWQIAQQFGITVAQFESWNGANVCNALQSGQAYCIAGPAASRPANAHSGATSSCRQWFDETNLLCWQIAEQFGITVSQFESWNGAGVCNILQSGTAYCVGA